MQLPGGVPALGKQKAVAAGRADAMNRRAPLGDIGNYVSARATEGYERNKVPFHLSLCFFARSCSENEIVLDCRKPQEQVNRPVTKSFGAQLVKNAVAIKVHRPIRIMPPSLTVLPARVICHLKNPIPTFSNRNVCLQKNAAIGPAPRAQRRPPGKLPPPEHVIEISSDSEQSKTQSESSVSSVRSRKKDINTLSSVLSARSKVRDLSKTSLL